MIPFKPYTFAGRYGDAHVRESADGYALTWGGLVFEFDREVDARNAGVALAFNGCSPKRLRARKVVAA